MYLYKVSPPRDSVIFYPTTFYRTQDYLSSADKPKDGHIEDKLLYAGEFDDVAIHLLPDLYRIMILNLKDNFDKLNHLGITTNKSKKSIIFIHEDDYDKVLQFRPTVYTFLKTSFFQIPSGEYVSREPVVAIKHETYSMDDAIKKWNIQLQKNNDLLQLKEILTSKDIGMTVQC